MAENFTGKRLKHLQSDNGREYITQEFEEFLKRKGISRRLTIPYSQEQNGVAEKRNRTLLDTRCLKLESNLPDSLWTEAINTFNYLRNRLPTKSLCGKTSYEIWTGKPSDYSHLEIFGSYVVFLEGAPGKMKPKQRGQDRILVRYSTESKGYQI